MPRLRLLGKSVLVICLPLMLACGCSGSASGPNRAPVALAGSDAVVIAGTAVELDGGASYDPEGSTLTYSWEILSRPPASTAGLSDNNAVTTQITPDEIGEYIVALVVDDGELSSDRDVVRVRALSGCNCEVDADCDDGLWCTGVETCVDCVCTTEPRDCSAVEDQCNAAGCDEDADMCVPNPVSDGTTCDDGLYCTDSDVCTGGLCSGPALDCTALAGECQVGICNEDSDQCEFQPASEGAPCDDGLFCTVRERCTSGTCGGGEARDCTASGPGCVDGVCDEDADACVGDPLPAGRPCDDGEFCTVDGACDGAGNCVGQPRDCSMVSSQCADGVCDEAADACTTQPANQGQACDDGLYCTQGDQCQAGACTGQANVCDDGDPCTEDICDEAGDACVFNPVPNPGAEGPFGDANCDDGADNDCDQLTDADDPDCQQCQNDNDCDDGNPCTQNQCQDDLCVTTNQADGTACDDGRFCTDPDTCTGGVCSGAPRDCSSLDDDCNQGLCNESADLCQAHPVNEGMLCDDGLFCTVSETCQAGACTSGGARDCGYLDGRCSQGVCDEASRGCRAEPINEDATCDDGLYCTEGETCQSGGCSGGTERDCSAAGDECNDGVCDEESDVCTSTPGPDGTECGARFCTGLTWMRQTCVAGACTGSELVVGCDDGSVCTTDSCDDVAGCVNTPAAPGTDCGVCSACDRFGACIDDLTQDVDCPFCQECAAAGTCVNQSAGSDIKSDCADTEFCNGVETCDGSGGCQAGSNPCTPLDCDEVNDVCFGCVTDDDCPLCQECGFDGQCAFQLAGGDIKDECTQDACNTGNCNGFGACGVEPAGTDCGTCQACDGSGGCVDDLAQDADCPLCQECGAGGACAAQAGGSDVKDECAADACNTGTCDGSGACGFEPSGTDCGVCLACDGAGACIDDLTQDADCPLCQECAAAGTCASQAAGSDVKDECVADACNTGNCDGAGACGFEPSGTDCGTCRACDGAGACGDDLTQNADCPVCQRCASGGACADQSAGSDIKDECAADACNTGNCDGFGACGVVASGTDCGTCQACDGAGNCADDLTQDGDCPVCQECGTGGSCVDQTAGQDLKDECSQGACTTGNCDGAGACGFEPSGTDCGVCQACDGAGTCADDLSQDDDCALCRECGAGGNCVFQPASSDVKNECSQDACNTGSCDGAGACGTYPSGMDCGVCSECDGLGVCIDDLSQDADCPFCQECAAGGTCADQAAGSDVKGECRNSDFCDGVETCNGAGACQAGTPPCTDPLVCDEINDQCVGCLDDEDCGVCEQCVSSSCVAQPLGSDVKNECTQDACNTGACNGAGACGFEPDGTDCGLCLACDGSGACADDLTQDADCPLCQQCAAGGACAVQSAGSDVKDECVADACNTGVCDGSGACETRPAGTDCGICRACNSTGVCIDDLTQDGDCPLCEECGPGGSCQSQALGQDLKNECTPDACNTGDCNGAGACGVMPSGTDCGTCRSCNSAGACIDDLTQDGDCGLCEECAAGGTCANQPAGNDAKNECASDACNTGNCNGLGACGFRAEGTDCGVCRACNATGTCVDDLTQDGDCALCRECGTGGACVLQTQGNDVKNECPADSCKLGVCDGAGACEYEPSGTDCGVCRACDGSGACVDDLSQDGDCALCRECGAGGACVFQTAGSDVKGECTADVCNTGNCDGAGACGFRPAGTDCGVCSACDGSGVCDDDLTQDYDCQLCRECGAGGICVNQAAGQDLKDDCTADACNTGNCDGNGACGYRVDGTDCGICRTCDGSGFCVDDLDEDADCGVCRECTTGGACAVQSAGSDVKDECAQDDCNTGVCDGAGHCGFEPGGTDCGTCLECNGAGGCVDDLTQDIDCPLCEECAAGGTCANQSAGSDVKGECPNSDFCDGVETCDGYGACQAGTPPCTAPLVCDEGNDQCVGCLDDDDCGLCEQCVSNNCVDQPLGSDVKSECTPDSCNTGSCDGAGACGVMAEGNDCGICRTCDGLGACVDDLTQDDDCQLCQECAAGGTCTDQPPGSDVKNECAQDDCNTGVCDGSGACGFETAGTDCGVCSACNATGGCIDDLTQDGDCLLCMECGGGGICVNQAAGDDVKNECFPGLCSTGDCDGGGACELEPVGTDCGLCRACDESGVCDDDLTQDDECLLCQECASGGTCADQAEGDDEKDECDQDDCNTGDCDGSGACGFEPGGTDCGVCSSCNGSGSCVDDLSQDGDCGVCEECDTDGSCKNQPAGGDLKNDCTADDCNTGDCDGLGSCEYEPAGTACAGSDLDYCDSSCNATGGCIEGAAPVCDDGLKCNGAETCISTSGCQPGPAEPDGASCDEGAGQNGNWCDSSCQGGLCSGAIDANLGEICYDPIDCTIDACDGLGTCVSTPDDSYCGGDLCYPACSPDSTGCVTPPDSMDLVCEDPVDLSSTDVSRCTITLIGGDLGQDECLPCVAEVGITTLAYTDFESDTSPGTCDLDGWTLVTGNSCYDDGNQCSMNPPNGRNCCDNFICPIDNGTLNGTIALQADRDTCVNGDRQWRLERAFDTTGLTDLELCFDYADRGANWNEAIQVDVSDGSGNYLADLFCDVSGPEDWVVDEQWYRYCLDLPAWAANNPAVTVMFFLHSDDGNDRIYLDNISLKGWGGGCTKKIITALDEHFDDPVQCDTAGWTITGTYTCPGFDCNGWAPGIMANRDSYTAQTAVDTSLLDGDIWVCFQLGYDGSGGGDRVALYYDDATGSGFQLAWEHNNRLGWDNRCRERCANLSDIDPDVNNNPKLGIRLLIDSTNGQINLYGVTVTGAQYCLAANGVVSLSAPPSGDGSGNYDFTATDTFGRQLTTEIQCFWEPDPALTAKQSVWFQP